jgi:signal transduction histidine kinase
MTAPVITTTEPIPTGLGLSGQASEHARRIDELGQIILAYSDVTEKLQQSHDQLLSTVQALQSELGEKNRELERRHRLAALGEMAAGMAHEIRNPLGGIQLYSSMLFDDLADRPASQKLVHKISHGVRRLESLVGQVLQFSREIRANAVDADVAQIVAEAVDMASAKLIDHRVTCHVVGKKSLVANFDPLLLGQAVLNLIINAADATPAGGSVTVGFRKTTADEGRQFCLTVADTGPGIPPELLDKIFNPFFTTKESGTGLGLSIVHRVVEAHDGSITASNVDGAGAKFEIRI